MPEGAEEGQHQRPGPGRPLPCYVLLLSRAYGSERQPGPGRGRARGSGRLSPGDRQEVDIRKAPRARPAGARLGLNTALHCEGWTRTAQPPQAKAGAEGHESSQQPLQCQGRLAEAAVGGCRPCWHSHCCPAPPSRAQQLLPPPPGPKELLHSGHCRRQGSFPLPKHEPWGEGSELCQAPASLTSKSHGWGHPASAHPSPSAAPPSCSRVSAPGKSSPQQPGTMQAC
uniref:Uncharacterized protein n=1 Tax=Sphaerodactylus townsendi TaxID=933632 RepID=A0ACB8FZG0_9SAUR